MLSNQYTFIKISMALQYKRTMSSDPKYNSIVPLLTANTRGHMGLHSSHFLGCLLLHLKQPFNVLVELHFRICRKISIE